MPASRTPPPDRLCPVINRVDIAWVCVATNDGHPLHLDRNFAVQEAGFQDVVVPGHLLIGWTADRHSTGPALIALAAEPVGLAILALVAMRAARSPASSRVDRAGG